jgi:uncharacterized protein (UPF0335 family)
MPRGKRYGNPELRAVEETTTNDLNDEQKARLFLGGIEKLERMIERKDEMVATIRNQRKVMKQEGFDRAEVDYALWVRKEGEDAARENLGMRLRIANWLGKPLGFQAVLDLAAQ